MCNVLTVQARPKLGDKKANFEKFANIIDTNSKLPLDLIVLPEFFNIGVTFCHPREFAEEENNSESIEFLKSIAIKHKSYVVGGSIIERDGDKLYNTCYFIDREGNIAGKYRKNHLYKYYGGQEGMFLEEGTDLLVIDTDFGKVGVSICFDLRFPKQFYELMKMGAEIITNSAAWCHPFVQDWETLNKARALDNAVYMVSSTLCGEGANGVMCSGNSMIVRCTGDIMSNAGSKDGAAFATLDMEALRSLRQDFPVTEI